MEFCRHEGFQTACLVMGSRPDDRAAVDQYRAEIKIRCAQCGLPFRFKGLIAGFSQGAPTVSMHGDELRIPLEPAPDAPLWEEEPKEASA